MGDLIAWLETHEGLSGWAQFFGAMLVLLVTYLTAFVPSWRRKRQLNHAALRLLLNGYEVLESYYRVSGTFMPFSLSVRSACLSFIAVSEEVHRFPVFELDDQANESVARQLVAMSLGLKMLSAALEVVASDLDSREATIEDQERIRAMVSERLKFVREMLALCPEWVHGADAQKEKVMGSGA